MYAFKDTVDKQAGIMSLCCEAISLDGAFIEEHVQGYRTLSVSGRESLEYSISDEDRPVGMDGMEYYGKRQGGRTLTVRFALSGANAATFMTRFRELKNFCKGEDRAIRFADEPNAHYTGTLLSLDAPEPGRLSIIGEMQFYCADPYLESDLITTVQAQMEEGKLVAHVNNDGSGSVYPVYRIKHKAENGYIGIVHKGGAFEMGNIEEADMTSYDRSERLLTGFSSFSAYIGQNPENESILLNGSLTLEEDEWLSVNNKGSGRQWHGGCYRAMLPEDSRGEVGARNFYCWWRSYFVTGLMGQTGLQQVLLTDESDKLIAGYGMYKSDKVGNTAHVIAWVPEGEFKDILFAPSVYVENPFRVNHGECDLLKEGSKLRFHYYGSYYSINVPEIENKKVTYIYVVLGDWGDSEKYMSVNKVGNFYADKNNVEAYKDVPNRYSAGSEVVVDCESDSITVRGLSRNDEMVTGSAFYPLPPGETDIEFYTSSWCKELPEVTVEYRKRWL